MGLDARDPHGGMAPKTQAGVMLHVPVSGLVDLDWKYEAPNPP